RFWCLNSIEQIRLKDKNSQSKSVPPGYKAVRWAFSGLLTAPGLSQFSKLSACFSFVPLFLGLPKASPNQNFPIGARFAVAVSFAIFWLMIITVSRFTWYQ